MNGHLINSDLVTDLLQTGIFVIQASPDRIGISNIFELKVA